MMAARIHGVGRGLSVSCPRRLVCAALLGLGLLSFPATAQINLLQFSRLYDAVDENDLDQVRELLTRGERPNISDGQGRTPLFLAARNGNLAMVELLLSHGARPGPADRTGRTPLYVAAEGGDPAIVETLVGAGSDVDASTTEGLTPLMAAARNGHAAVVAQLIETGADIERLDHTGRSALDWAETARTPGVSRLLREAGAP